MLFLSPSGQLSVTAFLILPSLSCHFLHFISASLASSLSFLLSKLPNFSGKPQRQNHARCCGLGVWAGPDRSELWVNHHVLQSSEQQCSACSGLKYLQKVTHKANALVCPSWGSEHEHSSAAFPSQVHFIRDGAEELKGVECNLETKLT